MTERAPRPEQGGELRAVEDYCDTVATSWDAFAIQSLVGCHPLRNVLYKPGDRDLEADHIDYLITSLAEGNAELLGHQLNPECPINPKPLVDVIRKVTVRRMATLRHVWRATVQGGVQPIDNFPLALTIVQANLASVRFLGEADIRHSVSLQGSEDLSLFFTRMSKRRLSQSDIQRYLSDETALMQDLKMASAEERARIKAAWELLYPEEVLPHFLRLRRIGGFVKGFINL